MTDSPEGGKCCQRLEWIEHLRMNTREKGGERDSDERIESRWIQNMITLVLTRVVKTVDESMKYGMQQQTYKPAASNQKSERSLKQVLGSQSASVAFVNHFFLAGYMQARQGTSSDNCCWPQDESYVGMVLTKAVLRKT